MGDTPYACRRPRAAPGPLRLPIGLLFVAGLASTSAQAGGLGPSHLVFHVETLDGEVLRSQGADRRFNPASVVKVATSLLALERLGPEHRFETGFFLDGPVRLEAGLLDGDLVVKGGADPDFHAENAFAVAAELNERGVRAVSGQVLATPGFWIGWEGGSERRVWGEARRARLMAWRLRRALDPARWSRTEREAWERYAARRGLDVEQPFRVEVQGGWGRAQALPGRAPDLVHRSKTLAATLRRLNAWSNNDIERIGEQLGPPDQLARALTRRLQLPDDAVSLDTSSGLGHNRMSARSIVALLRDLALSTPRIALTPDRVLPRAGCDPGTLENFPLLHEGAYARAVTGKTGTLFYTDGGVSVLAGIASTARGEVLFAVAAPGAGTRADEARLLEEQLVVELIDGRGGPRPMRCPGPLAEADEGVALLAPSSLDDAIVLEPATRKKLARAWVGASSACFTE